MELEIEQRRGVVEPPRRLRLQELNPALPDRRGENSLARIDSRRVTLHSKNSTLAEQDLAKDQQYDQDRSTANNTDLYRRTIMRKWDWQRSIHGGISTEKAG